MVGTAMAGGQPKTSAGLVYGDARQPRTPSWLTRHTRTERAAILGATSRVPCSLCLLGFVERVHASVTHLPPG